MKKTPTYFPIHIYIHFKKHKTCYIISPNVNVNDHQRQPTCFLIVPGAGAVAIGDHPRTIATRLNCLTLLVLVVIPQGQWATPDVYIYIIYILRYVYLIFIYLIRYVYMYMQKYGWLIIDNAWLRYGGYIANDHFDGKNNNAPLELLEYPIFRQPLMQPPSQKTSEQTQPVHFASQWPRASITIYRSEFSHVQQM